MEGLPNDLFLSENDIINKYRLGKLKDVYISNNCFYMPIRITGTGETLRVKDNNGEADFIIEDRTKNLFFKKDIIDQCARLPILLQHPKGSGLLGYGNKEALKQVVGQTIYSYTKGDEIWAIGRIYDLSILDKLNKNIFSTSPGVLSFCDIIEGNLSRETPIEINHIAFVKRGHWDCKSLKAFEGDKISIKEDALEELLIVDNDKVKQAIIKEENNDSDIVELPDEEVVVSHNVERLDNTDVVDEDLPILNASEEEEVEVVEDEDIEADKEVVEFEDDEVVGEAEDLQITEDDDEVEIEEEAVNIDNEDSNIETEIISSEEVTADDKARDKLIDSLNEICDSAHTSLRVKMPYIKGRETTLSIANKFINLNKHLLDKKFSKIVNGKLDNMNPALCKDFISSIRNRVKSLNAEYGKKSYGFVDTNRGYKVDSNF